MEAVEKAEKSAVEKISNAVKNTMVNKNKLHYKHPL